MTKELLKISDSIVEKLVMSVEDIIAEDLQDLEDSYTDDQINEVNDYIIKTLKNSL